MVHWILHKTGALKRCVGASGQVDRTVFLHLQAKRQQWTALLLLSQEAEGNLWNVSICCVSLRHDQLTHPLPVKSMPSFVSCRLLSAETGPQHSLQGAVHLREQQKGHPHQGPAALHRPPGEVRQLRPGAVPWGSVRRSLLLGDRVERGVLHRSGLQGHQPEGQRLAVSAGLQRQVLESPLLRHGLLCLAQPCGHNHQCPPLPQDRCVPGPQCRRAGVLQHRQQH